MKSLGEKGGARAQANELTGKPDDAREEALEEQVAPGIHDAVAQVAAAHGPAVQVHLTHDHEAGAHHLHSVHADGFEHHSDHASAAEAHMAAGHAAGAPTEPDDSVGPEGEYPEGHESAKGKKHPKAKSAPADEEDDYEVPELD